MYSDTSVIHIFKIVGLSIMEARFDWNMTSSILIIFFSLNQLELNNILNHSYAVMQIGRPPLVPNFSFLFELLNSQSLSPCWELFRCCFTTRRLTLCYWIRFEKLTPWLQYWPYTQFLTFHLDSTLLKMNQGFNVSKPEFNNFTIEHFWKQTWPLTPF